MCTLVRHQTLDHAGQCLDERAEIAQFGTKLADLLQFLRHSFELYGEGSVRSDCGAA